MVSRFSARTHLFGLITVALVPVWLFVGYLLFVYAMNSRNRFEAEAQQIARQVELVVEAELHQLEAIAGGLSKSSALLDGDMPNVYAEAQRLAAGTDRVLIMFPLDGQEVFDTRRPLGTDAASQLALSPEEREKILKGAPIVTGVYLDDLTNEQRIAVAIAILRPNLDPWILAVTIPTTEIRDTMKPAVPAEWTIGVGDRNGKYVARSKMHEETTGKPGLPEYLENITGSAGTFTSTNFQGTTLLAGYVRSDYSGWFYSANIPLAVAQAPLRRSILEFALIGLISTLVSTALTYLVGRRITKAARDLAGRATALGRRESVQPMTTSVVEFATIADALKDADEALHEREQELAAVMNTVPVGVWFTYDPDALQVIRNRHAAQLMGLPLQEGTTYGAPAHVAETFATRDGEVVGRQDRPLTRAMRGDETESEEYTYVTVNGAQRTLLSSARSIRNNDGKLVGAVQISLDITERKRGEQQRQLLVNELNHRVKNTLAVVQAVASQTLRNSPSVKEAQEALSMRLIALAKAHDILTHENWSGADLHQLLERTMTAQVQPDRFTLRGGPVRIAPNLALSLALGIHELTTNAIKYGAFSNDKGTVSVSWNLAPTDNRLSIVWQEKGGPTVSQPSRKGFGTRMIQRVLDSDPTGEVRFDFVETGLVCSFGINLDR
ncbi:MULTISPECIES: sensor histidine kinase [Mesorhizobium]|uniref:Blue-light-activated histidine kinase n=1 Tax=Mesorhizobium denitrificans TaxID=2294114 RepID=A0A371XF59_9HYPH|nr:MULTISPECIES: HWE histidine kinase domain-containing protein [Mesorhizobium]RFC67867.1 PAS domain S-box protein [Mesorhizobium denitrificans]